jgi:vancomycin resistance protein YoaR
VVEQLAATLGGRPMVAFRAETTAAEQRSITATAEELGYRLDVEATVRSILDRGRQANPLAALGDHLTATFGTITVGPVETIDSSRLDAWVVAGAEALSAEPREGGLEFEGAEVTAVEPAPGAVVLEDQLRAAAVDALQGGGGAITVHADSIATRTTAEDVTAVLAQARQALSGPVELTRAGEALTVAPAQLGGMLHTEPAVVDGEVQLRLAIDPADLGLSEEAIARMETDPVDASFSFVEGGVRIVPGQKGFEFNPEKTARQLVAVALSPDRVAKMTGDEVVPDFTVADAEALHITERVSTFTTYHNCCEPRVTNIHRIATLLNGTVVAPGQVFSVNDAVGPRTEENGFVAAPAIRNGEFVDEIGGGISQFATTMFNAIFFGGYDVVEHKPHSYYFTRYPMGREATVSWPSPDLRFRNDSDAGVYIKTSFTSTSITVSFYGSQEIEVGSVTGEPFNFTEPEDECMENPALQEGDVVEVQAGTQGFDVIVRRVFTYQNGEEESEEFFTRYSAQPHIVERKSCADEKMGEDQPPPEPGGTG